MKLKQHLLPVAVLLVLLYFPYFSHLATKTLRLWDETRIAHNAYLMCTEGDLLVTKYQGSPDMWNLKPPLLLWCQSTLMKIFGPWELAVRLPSAICGLLTALMILIFCWKYHRRFWLGFTSALIVSTASGYMDYHGVRAGDYDSMLTFFSIAYVLSFLLFFEFKKWKYFFSGMVAMTLAVLTKGISGLLLTPGIALAAIFFGMTRFILTNRRFYFSLIIFLTIAAGYYLLREHYNPGYIKEVMNNEWGGRYLKTIEEHSGDFLFYFENIHQVIFPYWQWFILFGIVAGVLDRDQPFRRFMLYITGVALMNFLLLSFSQTKIVWYIFPIVPLIAIQAATFIYYIFTWLGKIESSEILTHKILPYAFLVLIAYYPYKSMIDKTYLGRELNWQLSDYAMSYYLRDLAKEKAKTDEEIHVVHSGYTHHLEYYMMIAKTKGVKTRIAQKENLSEGDLVICSLPADDEFIRSTYMVNSIPVKYSFQMYRVLGMKEKAATGFQ